MVGGSPEVFEKVKVLVEEGGMGREDAIFHCGGPGAGLATKMINNYLSAVCILGVSEGMLGLSKISRAKMEAYVV